jgi:hypothetical protein
VILNTPWNFNDADAMGKRQVLLQKLKAIPQVEQVCLGGSPPATNGISMSTMKFNNGKKEIETTVEVKYADVDYFNLYKMKLIAGRFPAPADSSSEYGINENYARFLGFKDPADAVGKFVDRSGKKMPVVGVLADFYSQSLHTPIKPLVFTAAKENEATFHILLKPNSNGEVWKDAISQIEKSYKAIYPGEDVDYNFFD